MIQGLGISTYRGCLSRFWNASWDHMIWSGMSLVYNISKLYTVQQPSQFQVKKPVINSSLYLYIQPDIRLFQVIKVHCLLCPSIWIITLIWDTSKHRSFQASVISETWIKHHKSAGIETNISVSRYTPLSITIFGFLADFRLHCLEY